MSDVTTKPQLSLEQLYGLMQQRDRKSSALEQLANEQVTNQPWNKPGDTRSVWDRMGGKGASPDQSRALNQMYGSILGRDKSKQTGIGAASAGFEKGSALMDQIRMNEKKERMAGAQAELAGIDKQFDMGMSIMGEDRARTAAEAAAKAAMTKAGKPTQVTFDGKVYNQYPDGSLVPLGASEGSMNRGADVAKEEREVARDKEAMLRARQVSAEAGAATAGEIISDINDIRKEIGFTTTGAIGAVGKYAPNTDPYEQEGRYKSLKSKLAIGKLQEMRAAADNGASGFGQLTKNEFEALMNSIDELSIGAGKERQMQALDNIEKYYMKALADYESVLSSVPQQGGGAGGGYSPAASKYLSEVGG